MKADKGLSLLEILISALIGVMMSGVLFFILVSGQRIFIIGSTSSELHRNARQALDWIAKNTKSATRLMASQSINGDTYSTSSDELVLEIPSIDENNDIINIDTTFDYVAFHLNDADNTKLEMAIESNGAGRTSGTRVIASNVASISFSWGADIGSATSVTANLTTSKNLSDKTVSKTLSSVIKLRNKQ